MIISIEGLPGAGKTTTLTAYLYLLHKKGVKIYSNYHLKFPYTSIYELDSFLDIDGSHMNVLAGDELWRDMDARSSHSSINKLLSDEIMQLRKKNTHVIDTKQIKRLIDVRAREVTEYTLRPRIVGSIDGKPALARISKKHIYSGKSHTYFLPLIVDGKFMCDQFDTSEVIEKSGIVEEFDLLEMADKYMQDEYTSKSDYASYIYMTEREKYKTFKKADAVSVVGFIEHEKFKRLKNESS